MGGCHLGQWGSIWFSEWHTEYEYTYMVYNNSSSSCSLWYVYCACWYCHDDTFRIYCAALESTPTVCTNTSTVVIPQTHDLSWSNLIWVEDAAASSAHALSVPLCYVLYITQAGVLLPSLVKLFFFYISLGSGFVCLHFLVCNCKNTQLADTFLSAVSRYYCSIFVGGSQSHVGS